jgi:hypothetical protein
MSEALKKAIDKASELLAKREYENKYYLHNVDRKWVIEAMMDYAEYVLSGMSKKPTNHTDENGKPLTYWGGEPYYQETFGKDITELSENSWEGCDGCTEQDEVMYKNGYAKGYNAAISELSKEISDDEIFYQKQVMNPYPSTKHFYTAWEKGFMNCAEWYREQLNLRK